MTWTTGEEDENGDEEEDSENDSEDGKSAHEEEKKKELSKKQPSRVSSKNSFRFEQSENDPKYWPDTFDFPFHYDFQKKIQEQAWDWSTYRDEEIKALTHTTAVGQALCLFAQLHVNQESGSAKVQLSTREQEDRAARKFQSLW